MHAHTPIQQYSISKTLQEINRCYVCNHWINALSLLRSYLYDWATSLPLLTFMLWRKKWQPAPVFLPGESQGWGSLVGCRLWGLAQSRTWLKRLSNSSRRTRHQIANICWIIEKSKRVPEKHLLLLYWLHQSLWLSGSQQTVENSSRDGYTRPPDLPPEKSVCRSGSNG